MLLSIILSRYCKSQIFVQKFNFDKTPNFFANICREIKVVNS